MNLTIEFKLELNNSVDKYLVNNKLVEYYSENENIALS